MAEEDPYPSDETITRALEERLMAYAVYVRQSIGRGGVSLQEVMEKTRDDIMALMDLYHRAHSACAPEQEPGTLEDLLAFVRRRMEETDVSLATVLGVDLSGPAFRLAQRDGMATAFREIEAYLERTIARLGEPEAP